jgi:hypothetical protein
MDFEKNRNNNESGHWILSDIARSPLSQAQIWVVNKPDRKTSIKFPSTDGSTVTFLILIVKLEVIYV